jgi:NAD(P)-dependent dehydrogenase (short-subunit alcohol dehydrogenase family)
MSGDRTIIAFPFDLTGRVAVVTAGCAGIGATICDMLADMGATVIATSRDTARAATFEQRQGGRIRARVLRFDEEGAKAFVGATLDEFDRIDILVNTAAGRAPGLSVEASGVDDLMAQFRDGCASAFVVSQAVMAAHEKSQLRSIVNVGSIYGSLAVDHRIYESPERQTPIGYACAKGALVQMTRYLAAYWAPHGVRVNCVSSGGVKRSQTPRFYSSYSSRVPMSRMAEPREVAGAVAFLVSDSASYITGVDLPVDGGLHVW